MASKRKTKPPLPIVKNEIPITPFADVTSRFERGEDVKETDPIRLRVAEMQTAQQYFLAVTEARLWWIREMQTRPFEPWTKFWFQNRVSSDMCYSIMRALYKGKFLAQNELCNSVISTPETVRLYIDEAERFDLVARARDYDDKRRILVRPTRRTTISYENQLILDEAMRFALRGKYVSQYHPRYVFEQWGEVQKMRKTLVEYSDDFETIHTANALRRVNLVFDEEFYPQFIGKSVQEFKD